MVMLLDVISVFLNLAKYLLGGIRVSLASASSVRPSLLLTREEHRKRTEYSMCY